VGGWARKKKTYIWEETLSEIKNVRPVIEIRGEDLPYEHKDVATAQTPLKNRSLCTSIGGGLQTDNAENGQKLQVPVWGSRPETKSSRVDVVGKNSQKVTGGGGGKRAGDKGG